MTIRGAAGENDVFFLLACAWKLFGTVKDRRIRANYYNGFASYIGHERI